MTGVEILAMNEVVSAYKFSWAIYIGTIIVLMLLMIVASVSSVRYVGAEDIVVGAILGLVFGAIFGLFPANNMISSMNTAIMVFVMALIELKEFITLKTERYKI